MVNEQSYQRSGKRIEKELFYPSGKQRIAYIGLVDSSGVNVYMLDSGEIEYFKYADYNDKLIESDAMVRQSEKEKEAALEERDKVASDNARYMDVLERFIDVTQEMQDICSFPKGTKTRIFNILSNLRRNYRMLKANLAVDDGEQGD